VCSGAERYAFVSPSFCNPLTVSICTLFEVVIPDAFAASRSIFRVVHSRARAEPHFVMPSMMPRKQKPTGGKPEPSPFLSLSPPEWSPIFATRRENIQYVVENEPLIETRGLEDDDVVRGFMKDVDESDACLPRADKAEQYCFGASLEALQAEKGDIGGPIAWLDERSCAGGKEQARRYRGPLTAHQLYEQLKRPVSWPKF
jgi:hypothetical protein